MFPAGTRRPPCSSATTCITGTPSIGSTKRTGPPSSQTRCRRRSMTSPARASEGSTGSSRAPTPTPCRARATPTGRDLVASIVFDHTRWCSSSRSKANLGPSSNGGASVTDSGSSSKSTSSSITTRVERLASQPRTSPSASTGQLQRVSVDDARRVRRTTVREQPDLERSARHDRVRRARTERRRRHAERRVGAAVRRPDCSRRSYRSTPDGTARTGATCASTRRRTRHRPGSAGSSGSAGSGDRCR